MSFDKQLFSEQVSRPEVAVTVSKEQLKLAFIKFEFAIDSFKVGEFSLFEEDLEEYSVEDWRSILASIKSKKTHGVSAINFTHKGNGVTTTLWISAFKNSISMRAYAGSEIVDSNILLMLRLPFLPFQDSLVAGFEEIIAALEKNE